MHPISTLRLRLLFLLALLWGATTPAAHAQAWQWATSPGTGGGSSTVTDAAGNVYVTGYFTGTATFGATSLTSAGDYDIFVAKLNSSGVYQWTVRAGSSGTDSGKGVAVDGSGNVYVTGFFSGTTGFGGGGSVLTSAGASDGFVAKLSANGAWLWAARAGGTNGDWSSGVAVDGSGNVVITGQFNSTTATFGATTLTNAGSNSSDAFVAKLNAAGTWLWASRAGAGGTGSDAGSSVAMDGSGNVYVTGDYSGTATFGALTLSSAGFGDVFVAKLSAAGTWLWASRAGGSSNGDSGHSLTVDGNGNVVVTGYFYSTIATFGATTLTNAGAGADVFVAKLSAAGLWLWATRAGGANYDNGTSVAVESSGNILVGGYIDGTVSFGTTTLTGMGLTDAFVAKISAAGVWLWATSVGNNGDEMTNSVAVDGSGNVVTTGNFTSPTLAFGSTVLTRLGGGANALFISRQTQVPTLSSFAQTAGAPGATVTLTGTNLSEVTGVSFGGVAATSFAPLSFTSLTVVVPPGAATGPISVTNPYGTATSAGTFTVYGPPSILSFTPASGTAGTTVNIYGTNLTGATSVRFNSVAATFAVLSATHIRATVPATATTGPITLVTPGGSAASSSLFTVIPTTTTVSSFTPTNGPVGTVVIIDGFNFTGATDVKFGLVSAPGFTVLSATQISATVPPGAITSQISVVAPAGTGQSLVYYSVTVFTPTISSVSPGSGPAGAAVAITGTNFTGVTAVSFNNVAAAFTVISPTQITTTVPTAATTGVVRVTSLGGTALSPAAFTVLAASGVVFDIDSLTALPGTQVVIPVRVRGFSSMLGLQGTLQFNPAQLTFIGVEQLNASLTGLAQANFNTSAAASGGRVSVAYLNSSNTSLTLADNSVIFALRFSVPATTAAGTRQPIWWAPGPVPVEVTRSTFAVAIPQALGGAVRMPAAAALSGTVRTGSGALVPGVSINITGPLAPVAPVTLAAGTYSIPALVSTGAYTLAPAKSNDVTVTNGVTISDVALIQRHILGTALLGAAYKAVSADVNNDAALTVADVAAVQSFILGNTTSFTGGALWRFYSSAQTFANQNSPWPLTQNRTYASLATSTAQDFVGCKLGDVNDTWNAAIPRPAPGPGLLTVAVGDGQAPAPAHRPRLR